MVDDVEVILLLRLFGKGVCMGVNAGKQRRVINFRCYVRLHTARSNFLELSFVSQKARKSLNAEFTRVLVIAAFGDVNAPDCGTFCSICGRGGYFSLLR